MKQLFSTLLVIICSSCTIKNDEVESIEIMAYYYNLNIDQSKLMLDCLFYSRTNNDGFTEVLSQKLPSSSRKDFGYEYSINK